MAGIIEFLSEKPPMKKVVGGKRTVDAVTGPPIQKKKPKRLEPTFAKIARGISNLRRNTEMAVHRVSPIVKKRKKVKRTPIIRNK